MGVRTLREVKRDYLGVKTTFTINLWAILHRKESQTKVYRSKENMFTYKFMGVRTLRKVKRDYIGVKKTYSL